MGQGVEAARHAPITPCLVPLPQGVSVQALGPTSVRSGGARNCLNCPWRLGGSTRGLHCGRRPTTASCYAAYATRELRASRAAASGCCCPDPLESPSAHTWCRRGHPCTTSDPARSPCIPPRRPASDRIHIGPAAPEARPPGSLPEVLWLSLPVQTLT